MKDRQSPYETRKDVLLHFWSPHQFDDYNMLAMFQRTQRHARIYLLQHRRSYLLGRKSGWYIRVNGWNSARMHGSRLTTWASPIIMTCLTNPWIRLNSSFWRSKWIAIRPSSWAMAFNFLQASHVFSRSMRWPQWSYWVTDGGVASLHTSRISAKIHWELSEAQRSMIRPFVIRSPKRIKSGSILARALMHL